MNKTKRSGSSRRLSRRMLGFLLSVVMILGMMPNAVFSAYADEATYEEETTEQLSTDNTELVEEISEETSTGTDTELVVVTTEEPSTGTGTETVAVATEESSTDTDVETNSDEESDMLILYSTVALGAESAEPLAVEVDSEYPPEDTPGLCVLSFTDGYIGVGNGNEEVNYDFGVPPEFTDTPYWKNDPDHRGKLIPTTQEANDYNVYYDSENKKLYLNGLYLSVTGYDNEGPAVWIEEGFGLEIVIEADSTIICTNAQAISSGDSITFSGEGNLSLVSQRRGFAAIEAWGGVAHNGTGIISLEPAHMAWIGEVTGNGDWAEDALPIENIIREFCLDGEEHLGYAGWYLTKEEYENGGYNWNSKVVSAPIYGVHGASIQEVIDKLSGEIPVTFEDKKVSGVDISSDYIGITASATNYGLELQVEQYITSTRNFEGITFNGSSEGQRTNHPKENGIWIEDGVFILDGKLRELFEVLVDEYGLVLEDGHDLDEIDYISYISGEIHEAVPNTELSETSQYAFDLGDKLLDEDDLIRAIELYNEYLTGEEQEPLGDEWGININQILDGTFYSEDYYNRTGDWDYPRYGLTIDNPLPTLHINSQCDFMIGGGFDSVSKPANDEEINVYFGFLPDSNHKISFSNLYLTDEEYYASFTDEEFNGGRKHRIYNHDGAMNTYSYIIDYTKEDLTNGTIARGTMTLPISNSGLGEGDLKILMYEHATEEGSISGDYSDAVIMDMESIPDGKILGDIDITKDQLAVLETGESAVDIDLAVNELDTQSAANQTAVTDIATEATKGGYTNPFYMDLNLSASIRNASGNKLAFANGARDIPLTELEKPVEITVEIPKDMQSANAGREYAIVRRHVTPDGKVQTEVLTAQYDSKTKSLTFKTDKFSTYAIVYKEASEGSTTDAGTTAAPGTNATTPGTGDNAPVEVAVVLILATASMMIFSFRKRKMK